MSAPAARLLERLRSREARVGVVGLGYVGLPLAVELAQSGFTTTGIDLDDRKVAAIGRGASYIPDVASAAVAELTSAGRLTATVYNVNQDADQWHILYAWRYGGSLYTVSEHVAPPFGYRKVRQNLDRMLRNLVVIRPTQQ